ncbi:MAG: ornithine carbamoyltransferase [Myxococcota bacterium]|nr:ornithine carbamoyltransferase [Myxococcota bacterium]
MVRHFIRDDDISWEEQAEILAMARALKAKPEDFRQRLSGQTLGMLFSKSSTRTRVSFEAGMIQLGGHALFLPATSSQFGRGELPRDTAQVLSRYLDLIMVRTHSHEELRELAEHSNVPVINGLDELYHPCQALADLQTIEEQRGSLPGQTVAYVGDGNNVAHSLMIASLMSGVSIKVITPSGYEPDEDATRRARAAARHGATLEVTQDFAAVDGVDVVYTDVWTSMGQETESRLRLKAFAGFEVNDAMMARAKPDALFMHCLPAHRGEEVAASVIDGPQSVVYDQAENRLHAQKALLVFLAESVRSAP